MRLDYTIRGARSILALSFAIANSRWTMASYTRDRRGCATFTVDFFCYRPPPDVALRRRLALAAQSECYYSSQRDARTRLHTRNAMRNTIIAVRCDGDDDDECDDRAAYDDWQLIKITIELFARLCYNIIKSCIL